MNDTNVLYLDCGTKSIFIDNDEINRALNDPNVNNINEIDIRITYQCCTDYPSLNIIKQNGSILYDLSKMLVYQDANTARYIVQIYPSVFANNVLDGVYSTNIQVVSSEGWGSENNYCSFFDCETKNMLCDKLENLLNCDYDVFMMHYGLVVGSNNCNCHCEEMCALYDRLKKELSQHKNTNCGFC